MQDYINYLKAIAGCEPSHTNDYLIINLNKTRK